MTEARKAWLLHISPDPFLKWVEESKEKEFRFLGTSDNPFFHFAREMGFAISQAGPGTWVDDTDAVPFNEWAAIVTHKVRHLPENTTTKKQLLAITRTVWEELQETADNSEQIRQTVESALETLELSA